MPELFDPTTKAMLTDRLRAAFDVGIVATIQQTVGVALPEALLAELSGDLFSYALSLKNSRPALDVADFTDRVLVAHFSDPRKTQYVPPRDGGKIWTAITSVSGASTLSPAVATGVARNLTRRVAQDHVSASYKEKMSRAIEEIGQVPGSRVKDIDSVKRSLAQCLNALYQGLFFPEGIASKALWDCL